MNLSCYCNALGEQIARAVGQRKRRATSDERGGGEKMNWQARSELCSGSQAIDAILAAAAVENDLILVTRNARDYEDLDVTVLNPWHAQR